MRTLNLTLLQSDLVWENISENLKTFSSKLNTLKTRTDIIVLPEMFTTGFSMNTTNLAENMSGRSVTWLLEKARELDALLLGSLIIKEQGNYYNRLIAAYQDGTIKYYDKHHLFTFSGEHKLFTAGQKNIQLEYKGWKIRPLICYDLRFPVWARNTDNYDLLIYIASWPKARIDAWDTLLKARAVENMSYVVGVNRVGLDGNSLEYSGHSAVYNCLGNKLVSIKPSEEAIVQIEIEKASLYKTRAKLQFLNDKDDFKLN